MEGTEIKMTDLKFKPVEAEDMKVLAPYFGLRPNKTCDSVPLDSFIWQEILSCAVCHS